MQTSKKIGTKYISDKQICEAYAEYRLRGKKEVPNEILERMTGQPQKVCYSAMERANERGYIDYGVSLRTGWLTDKGNELLNDNGK